VLAPFGIRGEIKVAIMTDFPDRFTERPLYVGDGHIRHTVVSSRPHTAKTAVLTLRGVTSRDDAEALRDADLFVSAEDAEPLAEGRFYIHDIVGLRVMTDDGSVVGTVVEVMPTGSNDVYIVRADDGREVLIPAIKEAIREIDLPAGRIVVDAAWVTG